MYARRATRLVHLPMRGTHVRRRARMSARKQTMRIVWGLMKRNGAASLFVGISSVAWVYCVISHTGVRHKRPKGYNKRKHESALGLGRQSLELKFPQAKNLRA